MWWIVAVVAAVVAVVATVAAVVVAAVAPVVAAVLLPILIVIAVVAAVVAIVAVVIAIIDTFFIYHCDDSETTAISVLSDFNNEVDVPIAECKFAWNAKFKIEDLDDCILSITLRLKLIFDASITEDQRRDAKSKWKNGIEETWTDVYKLMRTEGDCNCSSFTVQVHVDYVESGEHHAIIVDPGNDRSNMLNWHIEDDAKTAAHEAGHMMGHFDEYAENDVCPDRDIRTDDTIMGSGSRVKKRHYETFAAWISNKTGCTYKPKCSN